MSNERENIPIIIAPTEKLSGPNEPITIYKGELELRGEKEKFIVDAEVSFEWFPRPRAVLKGSVRLNAPTTQMEEHKLAAYVDNLFLGDFYVINTTYHFGTSSKLDIDGFLSGDVAKGDTSIRVDYIRFSIPNLNYIRGSRVSYEDKTGSTFSRTVFTSNEFEIIIDAVPKCSELVNKLNSIGGYALTYGGRIKKLKGDISYIEAKQILEAFSVFLSFINGSQVNTLFLHGVFEDEIKWRGYKDYHVKSNVNRRVWLPDLNEVDLNNLWLNFHALWKKNEDDREALRMSINWYLEAIRGAGYIEGGILMTQTSLELLYNWILIDNMKLLRGSDAANLNAANKIRLLLAQLKIDPSAPKDFSELTKFVQSSNELEDAPDAIVQIRNAIVHAQLEKRKKLNLISSQTKYEALITSLWYVELAILFILDYDGYYTSRVNPMSVDDTRVPWSTVKAK